MSDSRLIFTGNVIVDLVMAIDRVPEPGGDTIASSSTLTAGGGYNVIVATQRDGVPVVFAGQYGTGPFGDVVRTALRDSGVEVVQPGLDSMDSGYCVALVDATTERTFVTAVGAEGQLDREHLDRVAVSADDIVYVSGYSLAHPVNGAALPGWLEELPAEARVMLDPSPLIAELDPQLFTRVLARTDILSLNAREAALATGTDDPAESLRLLASSIRRGGLVMVRTGGDGCWLLGSGVTEPTRVPGFVVEAVDTNGAGDAHSGVFVAALARGEEPLAAASRANAAAALAVQKHGPATAPTSAEIDAFLESRG
ncbi:PfkB family carbohydrate kinase [Lacisediminihabitans changchengi]|uniref:Sugar kinase n=1 Tax=Lacisediminihabitans changchengi TaxID=2787634 RepID=A0A934SLR1_9MICO|nr:PfkB family carbohydrate kinase [Lacisediminihabitans changchengi]MBK4348951.1 sugar kinase [Lacisediminihabitans changchengi]